MDETAQKIIDSCEANWEAHKSDCSGFLKAVATEFNITLTGQADSIVDEINGDGWISIADGVEAKDKADAGWFVVAGQKSTDHTPPQSNGHVAVIVSGPLAHEKYPSGYWGQLGAVGAKNQTLNYAWNSASRDGLTYAGREV
jgi:hypothetical protein